MAGRFCQECGAPNEAIARYCAKCGSELRAGVPPASAPVPSPAQRATSVSVVAPLWGESRNTMPKPATAAANLKSGLASANAVPRSTSGNSSNRLVSPSGAL